MAERTNYVDQKGLEKLNEEVYQNGTVDRKHLLEFLTLIDTNDAETIIREVKNWLQTLHDDPKYSKIVFPAGDIDAVISDLDSYGRVQPETIQQFKENSSRTLPIS